MSNVTDFPLSQAAIDAEASRNARAAAAAEDVAEQAALDIAAAKHRGIDIDRRVVFRIGNMPTTLHARVRHLGSDSEGRAIAQVAIVGHGPELHRVPLAALHAVCGTCEECRGLTDRPSCAR
jgi:hypothetical protein